MFGNTVKLLKFPSWPRKQAKIDRRRNEKIILDEVYPRHYKIDHIVSNDETVFAHISIYSDTDKKLMNACIDINELLTIIKTMKSV